MTTWTLVNKHKPVYWPLAEACASTGRRLAGYLILHTRMMLAVGLIVLGLGLPLFMLLEWLPVTLFLGFVGLTLTAVGCVLALFYSGEL